MIKTEEEAERGGGSGDPAETATQRRKHLIRYQRGRDEAAETGTEKEPDVII